MNSKVFQTFWLYESLYLKISNWAPVGTELDAEVEWWDHIDTSLPPLEAYGVVETQTSNKNLQIWLSGKKYIRYTKRVLRDPGRPLWVNNIFSCDQKNGCVCVCKAEWERHIPGREGNNEDFRWWSAWETKDQCDQSPTNNGAVVGLRLEGWTGTGLCGAIRDK